MSTIYEILRWRGISRLADLDVTGEDLREPVRRYEWPVPGDMIHVDVKKIGRIPDGGGWAVRCLEHLAGRRGPADPQSNHGPGLSGVSLNNACALGSNVRDDFSNRLRLTSAAVEQLAWVTLDREIRVTLHISP